MVKYLLFFLFAFNNLNAQITELFPIEGKEDQFSFKTYINPDSLVTYGAFIFYPIESLLNPIDQDYWLEENTIIGVTNEYFTDFTITYKPKDIYMDFRPMKYKEVNYYTHNMDKYLLGTRRENSILFLWKKH